MTDANNDLQEQYPALDLAYELSVDSYDSLIRRLDSIDGRLQTIMGFAATTMAVVPGVANARNLSFRSSWFWLAFAILALIIGVGSYARHHGEIKMINPAKLYNYQTWLKWQPGQFQSNFIYWAGEHFNHNNNLLTWKWKCSVFITLAFFLEVVSLVVWVAAASV